MATTARFLGSLLHFQSIVVRGFGRGSKELGIPTANLSMEIIGHYISDLDTGIYFGLARLNSEIYQCVISIGFNPFYDNKEKTVEAHLIHEFEEDFYDQDLSILICGFLREEQNFDGVDDLINAIREDIEIAQKMMEENESIQACQFGRAWPESNLAPVVRNIQR